MKSGGPGIAVCDFREVLAFSGLQAELSPFFTRGRAWIYGPGLTVLSERQLYFSLRIASVVSHI